MVRTGFTVIELIIVVSLISLIGASLSPFVTRTLSDVNLSTSTRNVVTMLRKAQTYAMDNKGNTIWGVCTNAGQVYLFQTTCSAGNYRETLTLPPSIALSGLTTSTFSPYRGEPATPITISLSIGATIKTITINSVGAIFVQ